MKTSAPLTPSDRPDPDHPNPLPSHIPSLPPGPRLCLVSTRAVASQAAHRLPSTLARLARPRTLDAAAHPPQAARTRFAVRAGAHEPPRRRRAQLHAARRARASRAAPARPGLSPDLARRCGGASAPALAARTELLLALVGHQRDVTTDTVGRAASRRRGSCAAARGIATAGAQ